ncbi:hypothetical protein [Pectobacterium sp. CHL-2024]|uniref:hypothetical protein n=1 Tax=Pectobacterium sp. CHL-2024 TaxID=3377079 RepID=UPI003801D234
MLHPRAGFGLLQGKRNLPSGITCLFMPDDLFLTEKKVRKLYFMPVLNTEKISGSLTLNS